MVRQTTYRKPTKPAPKPCPKCGRTTLTGLDAPVAALTVTIDAEPLTRDAELVYIVTDVRVYAVNERGEIVRQSPGQVLKHRPTITMHRVHDCDQPTPEALLQSQPPVEPVTPNSEEVPF